MKKTFGKAVKKHVIITLSVIVDDLFAGILLLFFYNIIQKLSAAKQIPLAIKPILLQNTGQCKKSIQFGQVAHTETVHVKVRNYLHGHLQILLRFGIPRLHNIVQCEIIIYFRNILRQSKLIEPLNGTIVKSLRPNIISHCTQTITHTAKHMNVMLILMPPRKLISS